MLGVFNMGIGMVLVVDPAEAAEVFRVLRCAKVEACPIGTVQKGGAGVVYEMGAAVG
jgi:phosphoribosylaminoimidazole (AIR) synthetase